MKYAPCISQIATLLSDPKRTAMMWALIDGSARAADELALIAGLSPSSASAHLGRLSAGGLLKVEARGRKRFFRIAAPEIGTAVEALANATLVSAPLSQPPSLYDGPTPSLRKARLCHDHLAGELASALYQRLINSGWLEHGDHGLQVTGRGGNRFAERGIYIQALAQSETVCSCFDWSERRPHLGGALGAGILQLFMQSGWLRVADDTRALQVTQIGEREIEKIAAHVELELVS